MKSTLRTVFAASAMALVACGSGKAAEKQVDGNETAEMSLLQQCQMLAVETTERASLYAGVVPQSVEQATAEFGKFRKAVEAWEDEKSACRDEGADVTERMALVQGTDPAIAQAEKAGTTRLIAYLEPNVDEAREFLKLVFDAGRPLPDEVVTAAHDVDRKYRDRLMKKFGETKKLGQLDDELKTTCVFAKQELDPNAELTENFVSIFQGPGDVHALCRAPLDADKYAGDPEGQMVFVLDDDADPSNGVLHEGKMGSPEEWKTSRYFKARFQVPQGDPARVDSGYYYVWLEVRRPKLGDEKLAHNWFYWHR